MEFYRGVQTKWNFTGGGDVRQNGILQWRGPVKTGFNSGFRQDEILQRDPVKMEFHRGVHTKFNFTGGPDKMEFYRGFRQNGILQGVHLGSVGTFQFCLAVLLTVKFVKKEKSQVAVSFKGKKGTCVV